MKQKPLKIGRNDPCPCGSGRKYKRCCIGKDQVPQVNLAQRYKRDYQIKLKSDRDIEGIRRAGKLVLKTLDLAASIIKPGLKTDEINTVAHDFTIQNKATPAPLNYRGTYPKRTSPRSWTATMPMPVKPILWVRPARMPKRL